MTVLDERGEPVQVEYVGPGRYLASGRWGGVGRYAKGRRAHIALGRWALGMLMPKRVRSARSLADEHGFAPLPEHERLAGIDRETSDERPGGRPEEEEE